MAMLRKDLSLKEGETIKAALMTPWGLMIHKTSRTDWRCKTILETGPFN